MFLSFLCSLNEEPRYRYIEQLAENSFASDDARKDPCKT